MAFSWVRDGLGTLAFVEHEQAGAASATAHRQIRGELASLDARAGR